jgi:hypothetical protein
MTLLAYDSFVSTVAGRVALSDAAVSEGPGSLDSLAIFELFVVLSELGADVSADDLVRAASWRDIYGLYAAAAMDKTLS